MLFRHPTLHRPATSRARDRDHIRRRRFRVERLEDRYLLSGISGITEFTLPSASASTLGITAGPDGNLWFTEDIGKIGMINPSTDAISEFATPIAPSEPYFLAPGPDGNVWFTDHVGQIGMISPATDVIVEFATPTAGAAPFGITSGLDGNVWFTEHDAAKIGMINPTTLAITEFPIPYTKPAPKPAPAGITVSADGNLWFTDQSTAAIGMINPTTHTISEFATPTAHSLPYLITAGPDGNLWFTEGNAGKIGMISPMTDAITEFATPTASSHPSGITTGPDGNLWFSERGVGQIGTIDLTTHAITEYSIPYTNAGPQGITAGPDGNLWFVDQGSNAIGVATLATTQLVVTQQPPPSVSAGTPFGMTLAAEDSSGNLVSSFNGTVTVTLAKNPGGATLGGSLSVTASSGVATFSGLTLDKAASGYTLQISGSGVIEAVTGTIAVIPAAATRLVITQQPPARVTAGTGFVLKAMIEDLFGNVVTSAGNTVSVALASNPGGSTLGGTLSLTPSQGVASFSGLTLTKAASGYTLQVSSSGLTGVASNTITVTPAAAKQLVITQQPPAGVVLNSGFGLQTAVEDAYGNLVTSASNTVKVALASNPTGAKLGGTLSVTASNGMASFSGLSLNKVGNGYTLQVSSNGLTSATTNAITVTKTAAPASVPAQTAPVNAPVPLLAPLVLDSSDFLDSVGLKKRARWA